MYLCIKYSQYMFLLPVYLFDFVTNENHTYPKIAIFENAKYQNGE